MSERKLPWRPSRGGALLPLVAALASGCADRAGAAGVDASVAGAPPATLAMTARFRTGDGVARPPPLEVPFPSDLYRDPDGTLADDLTDFSALRLTRGTAPIAEALRDLDGFGRNAGALFVIDPTPAGPDGPAFEVDPASLPADGRASLAAGASAFIVDLDADAATARVPAAAGWHGAFRTLTVQPEAVVLAPGRRHAFVLTTAVRAVGGAALRPSPTFAAIRDDAPGARSTAAGRLYGAAVDRVVALSPPGFDRARIAALAVFTTQTTHRQLRAACAAVSAGRYGPPPSLSADADVARPYTVARFGARPHPGWTATLTEWLGTPRRAGGMDVPGTPDEAVEGAGVGMAHDALGAVFTGTFEVADFRGAGGAIRVGADGAPAAVARTARIPVTFALPRGPAPARGFPVLLWGHGLRGHRRHLLTVANEMARRGIATVGIDTVTFGQRAVPVDRTSLEAGGYRGPDGLGDAAEYSEVEFFGGLANLVAFRDNLRQAALDLAQLRRLVTAPALDLSFVADEYGGVAPGIDPARVAYGGDSLGGLVGTLFGACDANVDPVVLNVPGGAIFTAIAADSPVIGPLVGALVAPLFGAPTAAPLDRFHPVLNLLQAGIDPADPASQAAGLTDGAGRARPHDVWVVESLWDEIIPNRATELLADAMGLPQIAPPAVARPGRALVTAPARATLGGATAAFFQSVPSTHGANVASRYGVRTYEPPFPRAAGPRFPRLATPCRVRQPVVAFQRNLAGFLASAFAGAAVISVEGMEPLVDMDDDGWTDDEERAGGTAPYDPSSHPAGAPPHARDVGF